MSDDLKRPSWDEYFLNVMREVAKRSTCNRGKPGCVFVRDNQILATGYAGSPPGFPHCLDVGDMMEERIRFMNMNTIRKSDDIPKEYFNVTWNRNDEKLRYEKEPTQHCIRTIHAEMNAIIQAAKCGISLDGATTYVSFTPCRNCAMALISVGVKRVVCDNRYHSGQESEEMFKHVGIDIEFVNDEVLGYNNK